MESFIAWKNSVIPDKDVKSVEPYLEKAIWDCIALAAAAKQLHWNVRGVNFKAVHGHLDELHAIASTATDDIAERLVALGRPVNGDLSKVASKNTLPAISAKMINDTEAIESAVECIKAALETLRECLDKSGEVDAITEDVMISTIRGLEKTFWMFQAQNE